MRGMVLVYRRYFLLLRVHEPLARDLFIVHQKDPRRQHQEHADDTNTQNILHHPYFLYRRRQ